MDFNGMFGKLGNGMAKLSMDGKIAIKTSSGYKTYDVSTGTLMNCANFIFPGGDEFFFVIPTNTVTKGDIVLIGGTPRCIVETEANRLTVINYESGAVETIVPEHHVFMGNTYFYGKIVSMFGNTTGKNSMDKVMKFMMMSEMMKGGNANNSMLPFLLMGGSGTSIFDDIFGANEAEDK